MNFFSVLGTTSFLFVAAFVDLSASEYSSDPLISLGDSINVKRYSAPMQETYALFEAKCSTCHGLKDTIDAPGALPSYWEKTVQDMVQKPNSGISSAEGQTITNFLIYDSAIRRRRAVKKQLEELPENERQAEQAKIDQIVGDQKTA